MEAPGKAAAAASTPAASADPSSSSSAADPLAPSTGNPLACIVATNVAFYEVWRASYVEEFGELLEVVCHRPGRLYVAIDFEFRGAKHVEPRYRPQHPDDWYSHLSQFVHADNVLQMGIALAFEPAGPVMVWDVNFHFDEDSGEDHGHDLVRHRDAGVLPEVVSAALLRHLPFGDPDITWIMYHDDKDVDFLLRLLKRPVLD